MKNSLKILFATLWMAALTLLAGCQEEDYSLLGPTVDVNFDSVTANGSDQERTTTLTLTLDQQIEGLSHTDVLLTSGQTGALTSAITPKGNGVYDLTVRRIYANGEIGVTIAKEGYFFTPGLRWVTVYGSTIPVEWQELTANGSTEEPTTKLTFTLIGDVGEEFTADDITFTREAENPDSGENPGSDTTVDIEKGEMTFLGDGMFDLTLLGVPEETDLAVHIEKYGYEFTPASKSIHVYPWTRVNWISLEADGAAATETEEAVLTTTLTFVFESDVEGLTAEDITIEAGNTGAVKGELKRLITGVYELPLTGIVESGSLTVSIFKSGFLFNPSEQRVDIHYAETDTEEGGEATE